MARDGRAQWIGDLPSWGLALLDEAQSPPKSRDKNDGSTLVLQQLPPSNETEITPMAMAQNGTTPTQSSNGVPAHVTTADNLSEAAATFAKEVQHLSNAVGTLHMRGLRQTRTLKSAAVDAAVVAAGVTLAAGACYGVYQLGKLVVGE